MEEHERIKEYYGKSFKSESGNTIFTIKRKGKKNSYITWTNIGGKPSITEYSNADILSLFEDGTWKLLDNEIEKYYNSLFYLSVNYSQLLYKIEKRDEETCNISLLNDTSKKPTKGVHSNNDVLSSFKNGLWVLFENKTTEYIHYYAPHDLFNGVIKKDAIYELYTNEYGEVWAKPAHLKENNKYILPKELVSRWRCETNIGVKYKPVKKKDLKVGDWVVILREDGCYHNCEQGKPQKVVCLDEGSNNSYVKVSFSDEKIKPKYYTQMRRATNLEIATVETTEVNYDISDVINKISI